MEDLELHLSMLDQIHINRDENGVSIRIEGVGSAIGFLEVLLSSKFQPGVTWKGLLSPYVNEAIAELLEVVRSDERFRNFPFDGGLLESRMPEIKAALEEYRDGVPAADANEILKRAVYPY